MRHFLTASALLTLASCSATGPKAGLVVTTDAGSYSLSAGGSARVVHFVATNRSDGTLYLVGCNGGEIWVTADVQSENGAWLPYGYGGLFICQSADPFRLLAGEQFSDSLALGIPGRYRISLPHSADSLAASYTPAHSNVFTIDSAP